MATVVKGCLNMANHCKKNKPRLPNYGRLDPRFVSLGGLKSQCLECKAQHREIIGTCQTERFINYFRGLFPTFGILLL